MKSFLRTSRALTIFLSLILCGMVGVAVAEQQTCMFCEDEYAIAHAMQNTCISTKANAVYIKAQYETFRGNIETCYFAHGCNDTLSYFAAMSAAGYDQSDADDSFDAGQPKQTSGFLGMVWCYDNCSGAPGCPSASAYIWWTNCVRDLYSDANDEYGDAYDSYAEGIVELWDAYYCLAKDDCDCGWPE